MDNEKLKDIFLDIIQNEKSGMIKVDISFDVASLYSFIENLQKKYSPTDWN